MKVPIINLLTDFGLEDNFVGVMKGVILGINPKARLVDLCHNVRPQAVREGAFLLRASYKYFPQGTVHLVVVDPGVGSQRQAIIAKTARYFFIGRDNGVLSLALAQEKVEKLVRISNPRYFLKPVSRTFHGRDIFAPCAAHISLGEAPENFGPTVQRFEELELPKLKVKGNNLIGEVIYIDRFGNLITNVDEPTFCKFIKGPYKIRLGKKALTKVRQSYDEVEAGSPLAIFDSFGNLEVAVNCGSAKEYFHAQPGLPIEVVFA